jgi:hypothetical protein
MPSSYNSLGEDSPSKKEASNNKGDVSQQIMDSHGSRVKKYGIYIDQLVEKIKVILNSSLDLFEVISHQTA